MSNDTQEFMEQMRSEVERASTFANGRARRLANEPFNEETEDKTPRGDVVQWADLGDGYMPTSATVKKLPAGYYGVEFANGQPYFKRMTVRTDEIMDMPDSKSKGVIEEIVRFLKRKDKFKSFGLLYKLGILMYGPPGSGKSITVKIIAKEMIAQDGIVVFSDKHPAPVSALLADLRKIEPDRMIIVVLEDVDSLIEKHGETEFLSLLDGENQIDNVIYLANTNYPERIDPRFVNRPSRFDLIVKIPMPNAASREHYLTQVVGMTKVTTKSGEELDLVKESEGLSLAHLREMVRSIFIAEHDPEDTVQRLKSMKVRPKSTGENVIGIGG